MKTKFAASLIALTLFSGTVMAQDSNAEQPAVEQTAQQLPDEVIQILNDKRPMAELSVDELKARAKAARQFANDENLPGDIRDQLKQIAEGSKGEIEARAQAEQQPEAQPEQQAQAEQPAAPKAEEPAPQPEAKPQVPEAVMALLADQRPANELDGGELQNRAKTARKFAKDENLPDDLRAQLKQVADQDRAELQARAEAEKQKADDEKAAQEKAAADEAAKQKAAEDQAAREKAAADEAAKQNAAEDQAAQDKAAADQAAADQAAKDKAATDQAAQVQPEPQPEAKPIEKPAAEIAPPPPPQAPAPENVQKLDANAGDPAAEQQAKTYLDDGADAASLADDKLRERLDNVRELLAGNELSRDTERAVRAKLKQEREVLRLRLAEAEVAKQAEDAKKTADDAAKQAQEQATADQSAAEQPKVARPVQPLPGPTPVIVNVPPPPPPPPTPLPPPPKPQPGVKIDLSINFITNLTPTYVVLRDRRPADRLQVIELQRRIRAYEEAQFDDEYSDDYHDYWRKSVAYDRAMLRERLKQERHRREEALALAAADDDEYDFEIDAEPRPSRRPPRSVFAAEVNDEDMMDVLTAPPPRSIQQRYKLKDIANQAPVRNSVSRIEIDTLQFGYNEGFVREEQLNALEPVAAIIEKILKKYPKEVFLIEGHTDAPGSDGYNLKLSKLRAESVKKALTSYFVIPPRNLRTVGLGERFLKIPTADAEGENRRVSVARITSLLSQGQ